MLNREKLGEGEGDAMGSLISQATGRDLLVLFLVGIVGGFIYKVVDTQALSKLENALQIPSGVIA